MSRVHTDQHFLNIFHKDDFHFDPSKMTRIDIPPRLKPWDSLDCSQDHLARRLGYSCGFQGFAL